MHSALQSPDRRPQNKHLKSGRGRRWGSRNKVPYDLKRAILSAAEAYGADGHGTNGLVGYLHMIAGRHPKAFCHLLGKTLPYEIGGTVQSVVSQVTVVSIPMNHYLDPATIAKLRPEPSVIEHEAQQAGHQDLIESASIVEENPSDCP